MRRIKIIPKYQTGGTSWVNPTLGQNVLQQQMEKGVQPLQDLWNQRTEIKATPADITKLASQITGGNYDDVVPENNPFAYTPPTYDLESRSAAFGQGIANWNDDSTFGKASTVMAGLGTVAGLARTAFGAFAATKASNETMREAKRKRDEAAIAKTQSMAMGGNVNRKSDIKPEILTGEYIYGLPPAMSEKANANVEKGEYIMYPDDGVPMEVEGERHVNGGTNVSVPEGSAVISDNKNQTLSPEFAKHLRDSYGIKVTHKNTYSDAIDKYKSKIGLTKDYEEEESIVKKIDHNSSVHDEGAKRLNATVLSSSLQDIQKNKEPKEEQLKMFSNLIFAQQEAEKNAQRDNFYFGEGGLVPQDELAKYAKKYKISIDEAKNILVDFFDKNKIKQYKEGDIVYSPIANPYNWGNNTGYGWQPRKGNLYGTATPEALYTQATYFPQLVSSGILVVDPDKKTASFADPTNGPRAMQELQQNTYNSLNLFSNYTTNPEGLKSYLSQISYQGDPGTQDKPNARAFDSKAGEFTTSRPIVRLNIIPKGQYEELRKQTGLNSINYVQLFDPQYSDTAKKILGNRYDTLSKYRTMNGMSNLDFQIAPYEEMVETLKPSPINVPKPVEKPTEGPNNGYKFPEKKEKKGNGNVSRGTNLVFPERLMPTPSALQIGNLEQVRPTQRSWIRQSVNPAYVEAGRQIEAQTRQLEQLGVPPSQIGAITSNLRASLDSSLRQAESEVMSRNTASQQAAQEYNEAAINQAEQFNLGLRRAYEAETLQAIANTEEDWRRYYDVLYSDAVQKANVANTMNTIQSMAPQYSVLPNGKVVWNNNPFGFTVNNSNRSQQSTNKKKNNG